MQISLIETKLLDLSFQSKQKNLNDNLDLQFANGIFDSNDKQFTVMFKLNMTSKEGFSINLSYAGLFNTDLPMTEKFKQGHFLTINAPAIVFPYLRSFVTTFSVNAGLPPIILPTINFQAIENTNK